MKKRANTFRAAQWGKLLILAMLAMGLPGHGEATSGTFSAPITIVTTPLTATQAISLNFGNLFCSEFGTCSVTQPANGFCSSTGPESICTAFANNATFTIEGAPNAFYNITLPNTITLTDTASDIEISTPVGTNLTSVSVRLNSTLLIGRIRPNGTDTVNVGATVTYSGSVSASNIISNFDIIVSYQ